MDPSRQISLSKELKPLGKRILRRLLCTGAQLLVSNRKSQPCQGAPIGIKLHVFMLSCSLIRLAKCTFQAHWCIGKELVAAVICCILTGHTFPGQALSRHKKGTALTHPHATATRCHQASTKMHADPHADVPRPPPQIWRRPVPSRHYAFFWRRFMRVPTHDCSRF